MSNNLALFYMAPISSDVVYTPKWVAKDIIEWLNPTGKCLDPCCGDGAFYNHLPDGAEWCEITKGRDFFDYGDNVDWIIGNPPYSIFDIWLEHSFRLANDVCYLVPTNKIFQRQAIMRMINKWGGIRGMKIYGSGQLLDFPFGFSVGAFHFSKDYKGECKLQLGLND